MAAFLDDHREVIAALTSLRFPALSIGIEATPVSLSMFVHMLLIFLPSDLMTQEADRRAWT